MKVTDLAPAGLIVGQGYRVGEGDEAASALIANKNYSISALTALMTGARAARPHPGTGRRGGLRGVDRERRQLRAAAGLRGDQPGHLAHPPHVAARAARVRADRLASPRGLPTAVEN